MPVLDNIKYILEALRQKQNDTPHVERYPGAPPRFVNMAKGPIRKAQDDVGYGKYKRTSQLSGEEPVSYEEWLTK